MGADRDTGPRADLSIKDAQTYGIELQDMHNPSKPGSIDESADPLFPPGTGAGLSADDRRHTTGPCVDGPSSGFFLYLSEQVLTGSKDAPIFTTDRPRPTPRIPGERTSPSLFGQLRNGNSGH